MGFEQATGNEEDENEDEADIEISDDLSAELGRTRECAQGIKEHLRIGRTWNESQHQQYMDFSTEVLTLKEMASREFRERQDATKKLVTELEDSARSVGELKAAAKTLREHVRKKGGARGEDDDAEPDKQQLVDRYGFPRLVNGKKSRWYIGRCRCV